VLPPPPADTVTAVRKDVDVLRNLPLFSEMSLDELRAIHQIAERCTFSPGEVLIEQDWPASNVLVILSGTVIVSQASAAGEAVLAELGTGASVGEMALVDEGPTSARVRAKTSVSAFRWPMDRLRSHLNTHERTALSLLKVISRTLSVRLRETNRRVRG
jgi:CRP-like cAMP-binding protein